MIPIPKNSKYYEPADFRIVPDDDVFQERLSTPQGCQDFLCAFLADDSIIINRCDLYDPLEDGKKGILCTDTKGIVYYIEAHQDRTHSSLNRAVECSRTLCNTVRSACNGGMPPHVNVIFYTEEDEFGHKLMSYTLRAKRMDGSYVEDYTMHYVWGGYIKKDAVGIIVAWE